MCQINFYIDKRGKSELKPITVKINHAGKQLKRGTGVRVLEENWNRAGHPKNVYSAEYKALEGLKNSFNESYEEKRQELGRSLTIEEVKELWDTPSDAITVQDNSITGLIEKLIFQRSILSDSRKGQYNRVANIITASGLEDDRDSIGKNWILRFVDYMIELKFANTTIEQYVKLILSTFEYHDLDPGFRKKDIKSLRTGGGTVDTKEFLTLHELKYLYEIFNFEKNKTPSERTDVIGMFLICAYTGMRYNELDQVKRSSVTMDELDNLHFTYVARKNGGKTITVPLPEVAASVFEYFNNRVPNVPNSKCNKIIREVFKEMSLVEVKNKVTFSGNKKKEESVPRYMRLSFHSSRSSYISNLLNGGLSVKEVSTLVGISPTTLLKYYARSETKLRDEKALLILNLD